jgi:hypothetical protein
MKNRIVFLLLLLSFISCKKKTEQKEEVKKANKLYEVTQDNVITMNTMTTPYDTLIHRIKNSGDRDSYDELFYSFMESTNKVRTDSTMFYSKIMAKKYHYERAYYDYFSALCEKYNVQENYENFSKINISKMDKVSRKQADDWLQLMLDRKIITEKDFKAVKR